MKRRQVLLMDLREKFARTKIQYAFASLFPQFLSVFTCIRYPIFFFRVRRDKKHEFHAQCMKMYHINDNLSSIGSLIDPSSIAWNSLLLSQTTTSFSLPFDLALVYKHSLPTYQPACLPSYLPTLSINVAVIRLHIVVSELHCCSAFLVGLYCVVKLLYHDLQLVAFHVSF